MSADGRVRGRHLVLIGLMGAGKTTVGEICATRLGRPFVDVDDLVVATAGRTVAEIFATDGEAGFRRRERAAITDACASPEALVLATGGGAVLDADNRRALRAAGVVVWLVAPPTVLAARVASDDDRPLLAGDPVTTLTRLADARADCYEATAHVAVDTDGRTVAEVADRVLEAYESRGGRSCAG